MKCTFLQNDIASKTRLLAIYYSSFDNSGNFNLELFNNQINDTFDNPETAKEVLNGLIDGAIPPTSSSDDQKPRKEGIILNQDEIDNVGAYFTSSADYASMESDFKSNIISNTFLKINFETGDFEFINPNIKDNGISLLQKNILKYKQNLINDIYSVDVNEGVRTLNVNMSDNEITAIISNTLDFYNNYLSTHQIDQSSKSYKSFVTLKNFDRLVKKFAGFINIDESYLNNHIDGVKKYNFKPEVEHYSGFSKDEGADITTQISDLANTILKILPDIGSDGKIIPTSFVGLSGYDSVMTMLKNSLLYSNDNFGENTKEFRKSYNNGAGYFTDLNNNYNIQDAINAFIEHNSNPQGNLSQFSQTRQLFLHNKLRSISKYLFSNKTPNYVKFMFAQMFYKTEPTSYRSYNDIEDPNTGEYEFKGSTLSTKTTLNQKWAFESVIKGGLKGLGFGNSATLAAKLRSKWDIKLVNNNALETITLTNLDNGHTATITYGIENGEINFRSSNALNTLYDDVVNDFIKDAFNYIIPDTYATCLPSDDNYDWKNDFAPFIALACKESLRATGETYGFPTYKLNKGNGDFDLKAISYNTLNVAQRLGIIYGDSIKNTIRSLEDTNLPLYQLTSLQYNWRSCIDDIDEYSPQANNILYNNPDLVSAPQIRSLCKSNDIIKSPNQMSLNELNKISIVDDFWFPFINGTSDIDAAIYLQNATFSDKARQFLMGYRLNTVINSEYLSEQTTLKDIINDCLKNGPENLQEFTRKTRRDKITDVVWKILSDYKQVFPEFEIEISTVTNREKSCKSALNELIKLDNKLKESEMSLDDVINKFESAHVDFTTETYAYEPKNESLGKVRVNETLLNYLTQVSSKENYKNARIYYMSKFRKDISSMVLCGLDSQMKKQVEQLAKWKPYNNFDISNWYDPVTKEFSFVGKNGKLHPIAIAYAEIDNLLSQEFNSAVCGEIWAHPNKNKDLTNDNPNSGLVGTYEEFSEANRLVNQIKRSVIYGSTIHQFGQGVKDNDGYENGVTEKIKVAYINDIKDVVSTLNGLTSNFDSQDGSGWCTALQSILENNSLLDAAVGENKKTILHDIDHETATPTLLKWAVYALSNSVRRKGFASDTNVENLVRKMYNITFNVNIDLNTCYKELNKKIIIKNIITGEYKTLKGFINNGNNSFTQEFEDGTTGETITISTLYDIDQLFGGAWTYTESNGKYIGNEDSTLALAKVAIKYNLRDKQISYAVNSSACKVGAKNPNKNTAWSDNKDLYFTEIHTKYGGVMMDADHDLDTESVTEMSQMISSLIEDGHYTDLVVSLYSDIGNIAINNPKIEKYISAAKSGNTAIIKELLGKSLVKSFQTGNKDTIGLAQAFCKNADIAFRKAKTEGKIADYNIPFDDPTIFGAFISNVISTINKLGIKRKYEGLAGVLNPSYNMIQYYSNGVLFDQFNDECREKLKDFFTYDKESGALISNIDKSSYSNWQQAALNSKFLKKSNGEVVLNPYLQKITANEVDFEDTIIKASIDKTTGEITWLDTIKVNSFREYDELRHFKDPNITYFRNLAAPKNLRGTDTTFDIKDINGNFVGTYSLFDTDTVRAAQYKAELSSRKKGEVKPLDTYKAQFIIDTVTKYGLKDDSVETFNAETQRFLKKLDLGKARENKISIGEIDPTTIDDSFFEKFSCIEGYDNIPLYVSDYRTRPAEIILGRYQANKLGIDAGDNIQDITDHKFFYKKLKDQFVNPVTLLNADNIGEYYNIADKIMYHNGKPFIISFRPHNMTDEDYHESQCQEFNVVGDDLRWEDEVITSDLSDYKLSSLTDNQGNKVPVIYITESDFETLQDSDFFDDIYRNVINEDNINKLKKELSFNNKIRTARGLVNISEPLTRDDILYAEKQRFDWQLLRMSKDRFSAFEQLLNFVGARIPTQSMQSYMPFKVIAWDDSTENRVYVPKHNTAIEGSDYR